MTNLKLRSSIVKWLMNCQEHPSEFGANLWVQKIKKWLYSVRSTRYIVNSDRAVCRVILSEPGRFSFSYTLLIGCPSQQGKNKGMPNCALGFLAKYQLWSLRKLREKFPRRVKIKDAFKKSWQQHDERASVSRVLTVLRWSVYSSVCVLSCSICQ